MAKQFCTQCGAELAPESKFCTACGAKVSQEEIQHVLEQAKQPESVQSTAEPSLDSTQPNNIIVKSGSIISSDSGLLGNTSFAAATGGEMVFTQFVPPIEGIPNINLTPIKYLVGGFGKLYKGITEALKDKKKLIPALIIAAIWLVLMILPILGINSAFVKLLSFLTFAQGGTNGGPLGMVGGIIGKGLFVYLASAIVLPIFSGGKTFKGMGGGVQNLISLCNVRDPQALTPLLLGGGFALIGYNFLSGNASLENSMVGIVAFILSLRALSNKAGFLRGFLMSLIHKYSKGKIINTQDITGIMAGWTAGFALGVPLSAIGIDSIGYLLGLVLAIGVIVLKVTGNSKKEVAAG